MTYPENRAPIDPQDMAKLHPSTWEAECRWQTIRAQQATDEAKALRARVAELDDILKDGAAIVECAWQSWKCNSFGVAENQKSLINWALKTRAALQQEGGE